LSRPQTDHFAFRSVEVILSEYMGQNRVIAQHRLPFSFNVENQYAPMRPLWKKRSSHQTEQSSGIPAETENRDARPRIDDSSRGLPGTERIDQAMPAVDLNPPQSSQRREGNPSSSSPLVSPQLPQNAGAKSAPLNASERPHQATAPPKKFDTGPEINAAVYPPGKGTGEQVAPRGQFSIPGFDKAKDLEHSRSGSNTGASVVSSTNSDREASSSKSGRIAPGFKETEIKLNSRVHPNPPSNTAPNAPDLDEAHDSRYGRLGPKDDASDPKGPNDVAVNISTGGDMGGRRGGIGQIFPGPKAPTSKPGPPHASSGTATSSVDEMTRKVANVFKNMATQARGSGDGNLSNSSTIK